MDKENFFPSPLLDLLFLSGLDTLVRCPQQTSEPSLTIPENNGKNLNGGLDTVS